ncbi:E3 ubiquitin-protein ligase RNF146 isoform X1 [Calliphora vicina]|uniref:E3 ubiquitin-protein ligase RNF146 isoform X1 n=1 Tax=Calliphora vicina TaxID=7373 RepID=UPI00325A6FB8
MENTENLSDLITTTTPDVEVEVIATMESGPPAIQQDDLDDSVQIIETPIEVLDLTSPQPSTSTSSNSAGAVGASNSLVKRNLEEALKEVSSDQNPSTSSSAATTSSSSSSNTSNLLECPICLQTCIHPARLPCGHIFCFLCVKGVAYKNRRCAMCRREIPPEFLDHPQLVNGIEDICTTKATDDGYQWFYEGRNGWWQYDDRTSQDLEEAFKKGERSCTILVAGYVYIVDFDAMIQQRQNEPARCRRVKRDLATIPKKGVAGLRIEGNTVTTDSNFAAQVYQSRQNRYRSGELLNDGDLETPDNAILRTHAPNDPASPNPQGRLRLSYGGLGGYVIELGNPSEFVSTAAATDAALRIASDIIGSTLAHADELTRSGSNNTPSTSANNYHHHTINNQDTSLNSSSSNELSLNDLTLNTHLTTSPATATTNTAANNMTSSLLTNNSVGGGVVNLSRERGSRELLGAAEDLLGATQRVIATADQPTIDLFEQTLNDFHALTLRNIVDSSDDDNDAEQQQHSTPTGQRSSFQSYNQENP